MLVVANIEDYLSFVPTLKNPVLKISMTDETFRETYEGSTFSKIEIKDMELDDNNLHVYGYTIVLGNSFLVGQRRFDLYMKNGRLGWESNIVVK